MFGPKMAESVDFLKRAWIAKELKCSTLVWEKRQPLQAKTRLLVAALTVILSLSLMPALHAKPAYACTPIPGGDIRYTVGDRTSAAEVVLEGTVADVSFLSVQQVAYSATVEVHQYFKGSGPATVVISGFGPSSLCYSWVGTGNRYIFYAQPYKSDELSAHYLGPFHAVDTANTETIAEVMAAVGQGRETKTPTPSATVTTTLTPTPTPTAALTITPIAPGSELPDLVILGMGIDMETGGDCDFTSTALGLAVWVQNIGSGPAGPFVVEVNGVQVLVEAGLLSGERLRLWFKGYMGVEITALVDATSLVEESDEANNSLTPSRLPIPTLPPTCTPTPTTTLTPTPTATIEPTATSRPNATPTPLEVPRAEQPATSESSGIGKETPSSGGACSAPIQGGTAVVDISAIAVMVGLVGLTARRKPRVKWLKRRKNKDCNGQYFSSVG